MVSHILTDLFFFLPLLFQACIDDNLDMVEFLVEHQADVDVCDNEGWTPLHATSSCAFTEIARWESWEGKDKVVELKTGYRVISCFQMVDEGKYTYYNAYRMTPPKKPHWLNYLYYQVTRNFFMCFLKNSQVRKGKDTELETGCRGISSFQKGGWGTCIQGNHKKTLLLKDLYYQNFLGCVYIILYQLRQLNCRKFSFHQLHKHAPVELAAPNCIIDIVHCSKISQWSSTK